MAKKKEKKPSPGAIFNAFLRRSAWFGILVGGMFMVYSLAVDDSGASSTDPAPTKPFFAQIWESRKPEMDDGASFESDGYDPSSYGSSDGTDSSSYGSSDGSDPSNYGSSYGSASAETPDPEAALTEDPGDAPPPVDPMAFLTDPGQKTEPVLHNNTVTRGPDSALRYGDVLIQEPNPDPIKSPTGPMVTNFLELFDFSITPEWVEERWSCIQPVGPITTRGYRVAISTGPEVSDLVGSLTYYFDNKLELVKINFEGYTGELDRLLQTLTYFHFSRRVTNDPNAILYASEVNSKGFRSFLKTYHRLNPTDSKDPRKKYWITLELCAPEQ